MFGLLVLTESTIDVNTGEKIACQLEKGVSTGKFVLLFFCVLFDLCFKFMFLFQTSFFLFCAEEFFPDPLSWKETTIDIGKMKEVAQEPATPAEVLETIPGGVDPEAYKRCLEYCQAQGVNLDTFKFVGIGLDRLRIMLKKL